MNNSNKYYFSAISPFLQTNKVENVEKEIKGKDFIGWGNDNHYPEFLFDLYNTCTTFQTVVNGTSDFIVGDEIICNSPNFSKTINKTGETIRDLVMRLAVDYLIFGGFAFQVIKGINGQPSELYWLDFSKLRTDKKNEVIFYSEDWKRSSGRVKYIIYPKWGKDDENPTSVVYFKGNKTRGTYPTPLYNAAITAIQVQTKIDEFHLNEISNGFMSTKMINFNNGVPDDGIKQEIERNINEKFTGSENAGRLIVSFNDSKDNETTIADIATDDFPDRYAALSKRTENQIYAAFRATPNIFGVPTETTGFNAQEYDEAFKLYNRTCVKPIQKMIIDSIDKVLGMNGCITITPYSINNRENDVE